MANPANPQMMLGQNPALLNMIQAHQAHNAGVQNQVPNANIPPALPSPFCNLNNPNPAARAPNETDQAFVARTTPFMLQFIDAIDAQQRALLGPGEMLDARNPPFKEAFGPMTLTPTSTPNEIQAENDVLLRWINPLQYYQGCDSNTAALLAAGVWERIAFRGYDNCYAGYERTFQLQQNPAPLLDIRSANPLTNNNMMRGGKSNCIRADGLLQVKMGKDWLVLLAPHKADCVKTFLKGLRQLGMYDMNVHVLIEHDLTGLDLIEFPLKNNRNQLTGIVPQNVPTIAVYPHYGPPESMERACDFAATALQRHQNGQGQGLHVTIDEAQLVEADTKPVTHGPVCKIQEYADVLNLQLNGQFPQASALLAQKQTARDAWYRSLSPQLSRRSHLVHIVLAVKTCTIHLVSGTNLGILGNPAVVDPNLPVCDFASREIPGLITLKDFRQYAPSQTTLAKPYFSDASGHPLDFAATLPPGMVLFDDQSPEGRRVITTVEMMFDDYMGTSGDPIANRNLQLGPDEPHVFKPMMAVALANKFTGQEDDGLWRWKRHLDDFGLNKYPNERFLTIMFTRVLENGAHGDMRLQCHLHGPRRPLAPGITANHESQFMPTEFETNQLERAIRKGITYGCERFVVFGGLQFIAGTTVAATIGNPRTLFGIKYYALASSKNPILLTVAQKQSRSGHADGAADFGPERLPIVLMNEEARAQSKTVVNLQNNLTKCLRPPTHRPPWVTDMVIDTAAYPDAQPQYAFSIPPFRFALEVASDKTAKDAFDAAAPGGQLAQLAAYDNVYAECDQFRLTSHSRTFADVVPNPQGDADVDQVRQQLQPHHDDQGAQNNPVTVGQGNWSTVPAVWQPVLDLHYNGVLYGGNNGALGLGFGASNRRIKSLAQMAQFMAAHPYDFGDGAVNASDPNLLMRSVNDVNNQQALRNHAILNGMSTSTVDKWIDNVAIYVAHHNVN